MKNKLMYLTKMSLNKQIKTKWFLIANIIFGIIIIGLINFDSIIKLFGGDFNEVTELLVIDEVDGFDNFKAIYEENSKYVEDYDSIVITKYEKDYDSAKKMVSDDDKILLVIKSDNENYIKGELVSNDGISTITETLIKTSLSSLRSSILLDEYNINPEVYMDINKYVDVENIYLDEDKLDNDMTISSIMQIITLPMFLLITFLVQMIGAEVNEEKSTKSMEIIISNVSPKVHFLSKVISSNLFVFIQGLLLIIFAFIGIVLRLIIGRGSLIGDLSSEIGSVLGMVDLENITNTISYMIPIMIVMFILTFIAYSLLAGILASMTTNLEDFQQLQTPIIIISLIGYYLSIVASVFKGSIFIKIMTFIPLISAILAPTMYVLGEISMLGLIVSILLLVGLIYLLIKYGLRIYKVGILNYSQTGLWKKMFRAIKEK